MHETYDRLSRTLDALAHPHRRAILARLALGDADVAELTRRIELSQPAVSKHLKVLERAGLVATRKDRQRRPRTLVPAPLADLDGWLECFRNRWEDRFGRLDELLGRSPEQPSGERN